MHNDAGLGSTTRGSHIKEPINPVEAIKKWLNDMGQRGMYGPESARLRATAISQLTSVLGPEEAHDAASLLDNIEDLGRRYARSKNGKPETVSTYVSRAKLSLQDFINYQADPTKFKGSPVGPRSTAKTQTKKSASLGSGGKQTSDKAQASATAGQAADRSESSPNTANGVSQTNEGRRGEMRSFPLGKDGRTILYALPPEGFTMRDVYKFLVHVATMAEDFDPFDRQQSAVFALVKPQE